MGKKRNHYTKAFKIEAVRLVVEEGRRVSEVARELGMSEGLLRRWKIKYEEGKEDPFPGNGRLSPEDKAFRQLKRENVRLRMERDILKKAVAIFSEEPRKQENRRLLMEIKMIHQKSRKNYGSPRIHVELNENDHFCSKHRVARLMSQNGIVSKHKQKFKVTTNSVHSFPIAKNLLKRNFYASEPG